MEQLSLYLRPSKRPDWLCVDQFLGSLGLVDDSAGRGALRRGMQKRVVEIAHCGNPMEADAAWKDIRRGWCFGSERFRDELLDRLDDIIGVSGKRESFNGVETRRHDEQEAERILVGGLGALSIGEKQLKEMRKSCPEKCVLAWYVRKRTCVSNEWIKRRLHMGKATNFSALVKRVDEGGSSVKYLVERLDSIRISD